MAELEMPTAGDNRSWTLCLLDSVCCKFFCRQAKIRKGLWNSNKAVRSVCIVYAMKGCKIKEGETDRCNDEGGPGMWKNGVLPRRVGSGIEGAESRLPLWSGYVKCRQSGVPMSRVGIVGRVVLKGSRWNCKIKVRSTLDYHVVSVHLVVWGWLWVIFHFFGWAAKTVFTELTSFPKIRAAFQSMQGNFAEVVKGLVANL